MTLANLRSISGQVTFEDPQRQREFAYVVGDLSIRFAGSSLVASPSLAPGDASVATTHGTPPPAIPFAAILTFGERATEPLAARFVRLMRPVLYALGETAKGMGGLIGAGGAVLTAVMDVLKSQSPTRDQVAALGSLMVAVRDAELPSLNELKAHWRHWEDEGIKSLKLDELSEADWRTFLDKVKKQSEGAKSQTSGAPANAADGSPQEASEVSATGGAPAAAALPSSPFVLTQLSGWLDPDLHSEHGDAGYRFQIEGQVRYNTAEYQDGARFDVLGPDGSQLATLFLSGDEVEAWFEKQTDIDAHLKDVSFDLRWALDRVGRASRKKSQARSIRGRFWRTDGEPLGVRQFALLAPPQRAKRLTDPCHPDPALWPVDDKEDCGCGEGRPPLEVIRAPIALAIASTDEQGYFELSYAEPEQQFDATYALLRISGVRCALAIEFKHEDGKGSLSGRISLPSPLLLPIDADLLAEPTDTNERSIRWVDEDTTCEDGCGRSLFEPSRPVDEYEFHMVVRTTDPMITRGRLGETESMPAPSDWFRLPLDRNHSIDWDSRRPMLAQAVTISHGRILSIKQRWCADGYSMGDLLYSLPLAPLQKKNIAIIDWQREDSTAAEGLQTNSESLNNFVGRERDISEIVNSSLSESIHGRSESGGRASSGGIGGLLGGFLGSASSGSSSAWSSSSQEATRLMAGSLLNRLRDNTIQSANAYRAQRVTTVKTTTQSESASARSETVANRNACHAVTIQYFEVLRHLKIDFELAAVRECLYVPLPITPFDEDKLHRWEDTLRSALPTSDLKECLEGAVRLKNQYDYPVNRYCDEVIDQLEGRLSLTLEFPMPSALLVSDQSKYQGTPESYEILSLFAVPLAPIWFLPEVRRDHFFVQTIAPEIARRLVGSLQFFAETANGKLIPLPLEATLLGAYHAGQEHSVSLRASSNVGALGLTRANVQAIRIRSPLQIPLQSSVILRDLSLGYSTAHYSGPLVERSRENNALMWRGLSFAESDDARVATPCKRDELENPKSEDVKGRQRLLDHLNEFLERYHKVIWALMDPDRRFALLDSFIAPNSGGRSVASVVENRLMGIVGNCLVLPVSPGLRLDYFSDMRSRSETDGASEKLNADEVEDELLALYRPLIPNPSLRIAIPTRGVFAESVMGGCNSCEKMDDSRNWKYWEHPLPDEPTAIQGLSLETRERDAQPFVPQTAQPMISQVVTQLPAAPDPASLGQVLQTLSGAEFRDASGLQGTQQTAREALADSFATTRRFGEMTTELITKAAELVASVYTGRPLMSDPKSVKESIGKDAAAGRITPDQAQDAIAKVNEAMADNLSVRKNANLLEHPEVSAAIGSAASRGAPISLKRGDTQVKVGLSPQVATPQTDADRTDSSRLPWPLRLFAPRRAEALPPPAHPAPDVDRLFRRMWMYRESISNWKGQDIYSADFIAKHAERDEEGRPYLNMCATRISAVLHDAGMGSVVEHGPGVTLGLTAPSTKPLRKYYPGAEALALRLKDLVSPLELNSSASRAAFQQYLSGKRGIVFLKDYYRRDSDKKYPTGDHIELWDRDHLPPGYWRAEQIDAYKKAGAIWFWAVESLVELLDT